MLLLNLLLLSYRNFSHFEKQVLSFDISRLKKKIIILQFHPKIRFKFIIPRFYEQCHSFEGTKIE